MAGLPGASEVPELPSAVRAVTLPGTSYGSRNGERNNNGIPNTKGSGPPAEIVLSAPY